MPENYSIEHDTSDGHKHATIRQNEKLDLDAAKKLYLEVTELISQGMDHFTLNLHEVKFCDSATIGAWVMIHKAVSDGSAHLDFEILRDSQVHSAISVSNLDRIFSLILT